MYKLTPEAERALEMLPDYMQSHVAEYVEHGTPPGSFLSAVINNNLREACTRADETNKNYIFEYVYWFYNHAPAGSWGFDGATEKWYDTIQKRKKEAAGETS